MKKALIIGGSSGIGFNTAKRLSARDVLVTITGRDHDKLIRAAESIEQDGKKTSRISIA